MPHVVLAIFATCSWPSLCKQSELQCFASDLRPMFAQRRLLLCRNRNVIWSKIVQNFLYFEHPTREDIAN